MSRNFGFDIDMDVDMIEHMKKRGEFGDKCPENVLRNLRILFPWNIKKRKRQGKFYRSAIFPSPIRTTFLLAVWFNEISLTDVPKKIPCFFFVRKVSFNLVCRILLLSLKLLATLRVFHAIYKRIHFNRLNVCNVMKY